MAGGLASTPSLLLDLCWVVLGALLGGAVAARLRQPILVGYLLMGLVMGPHGLRWLADPATIDRLATIGVAFLMFSLGVEVSWAALERVWRAALGAGLFQLALTLATVTLCSMAFGQSPGSSVAIAAIVALSSTALVMRILSERGELDSLHGRLLLGVLLVQDLAVVPIALMLPALGGGGAGGWDLFLRLVAEVAFVGAALGLGFRWAPALLSWIAGFGRTELVFLSVLGLCLGLAALAELSGVGIALGAFFAGLAISASPQSRQALADIEPLRNLFATVFFVSLGMLIDPRLVLASPWTVVLLLAAIVLLKAFLGALGAKLWGNSGRVSLAVGLGLAQIGEFSFVLASLARQAGLLDAGTFAGVLGAALASLLLAPLWLAIADPLASRLERFSWMTRAPRPLAPGDEPEALRQHVVIAGYGRMGANLARELQRWGVPVLAVDTDARAMRDFCRQGGHSVVGDASRAVVLRHCALPRARLLFIALPDPLSAERCLIEAKREAPGLDVIARVHRTSDVDPFYQLGAREVIQPEFEASLEATRSALVTYGFDPREVGLYLHQVRTRRYVAMRGSQAVVEGRTLPVSHPGLSMRWLMAREGAEALHWPLIQLDHPHQWGVALLALRRGDVMVTVPESVERLLPGDRLLVLAAPEAIARLVHLVEGEARLAEGNETG